MLQNPSHDLSLVLSKVLLPGLHAVLAAARAGLLSAGSFNRCLLHHLSAKGDGHYAVNHKRDLDGWLGTLATNDAELDALRAACRRIIRAFDGSHPEDELILDAGLQDYHARYGCHPEYELPKAFVVECVVNELSRRQASAVAPVCVPQTRQSVAVPV